MTTALKSPFVTKDKSLNDLHKLRLVNILLEDLDRPDPTIEKTWAIESKRRLRAMRSGKMKSYTIDDLF
jgi:hypothetical protein